MVNAKSFLKGGWVFLAPVLLLCGCPPEVQVQVQTFQLDKVQSVHDRPYLAGYRFRLRDAEGHAIVGAADTFEVHCYENDAEISPSETGLSLVNDANRKLRCFLVLDYTRSMSWLTYGDSDGDGISDAIERMEESAKLFVDSLAADAQVGIYEFHREDVEPQQVTELSVNKEYVKDQIDRIWGEWVRGLSGGSRCWDAVYSAVAAFRDPKAENERRMVLFVSDGRDESSVRSPYEIVAGAQGRDVNVYCIGLGAELEPFYLEWMATATEGAYYEAASAQDLGGAFRQSLQDMGGFYTLRWATLKRGANRFQPSFELRRDGFQVSYIAPETYKPSSYAGDPLSGRLTLEEPPALGGVKTAFLRADYVPRSIQAFRFFLRSPYVLEGSNVQVVGAADHGLCPDWSVREMTYEPAVGGWWISVASPDTADPAQALPYASFGPLLRIDIAWEGLGLLDAFLVDNSAYQGTGDQRFSVEGGRPYTVTVQDMEFAWIPPGLFDMGSDARSNEEPVHQVEVSRGFWLGRREITQRQWQLIMGATPSTFAGSGCSGYPVETVSWDEVQQFIQALEVQTGRAFRLPTEAEWEYACRAGSGVDYGSGNTEEELQYYASYGRQDSAGPQWVGTKEPNAFGVYDMHGNVWEMCADWYASDYYNQSPAVDPTGPEDGERRVIRGGGYSSPATDCRSARRSSIPPHAANWNTGFRLVLDD